MKLSKEDLIGQGCLAEKVQGGTLLEGFDPHGDLLHRERDRSGDCKLLQNLLEVWKILLRRKLFGLNVSNSHKERKRVKETENL